MNSFLQAPEGAQSWQPGYVTEFATYGTMENSDLYHTDDGRARLLSSVESIALDLVSGVHAMQEEKFAHLDLRPANVMFTDGEDGKIAAKMANFDNARKIPKSLLTDREHHGVYTTSLGDPAAHPFEFFSMEKDTKRRITSSFDIFGLGSLLFSFCEILLGNSGPSQLQEFNENFTVSIFKQLIDDNTKRQHHIDDRLFNLIRNVQGLGSNIPFFPIHLINLLLAASPNRRRVNFNKITHILTNTTDIHSIKNQIRTLSGLNVDILRRQVTERRQAREAENPLMQQYHEELKVWEAEYASVKHRYEVASNADWDDMEAHEEAMKLDGQLQELTLNKPEKP